MMKTHQSPRGSEGGTGRGIVRIYGERGCRETRHPGGDAPLLPYLRRTPVGDESVQRDLSRNITNLFGHYRAGK